MIGTRTAWLLIVLLGVAIVFAFALPGTAPFPRKYTADVGMSVGVAPNPYNTLDAQLAQKQMQLDEQQTDLQAQEAAFASSSAAASVVAMSPIVLYLGIAVVILTFLVVMNFYFDWRRSRITADSRGKIEG